MKGVKSSGTLSVEETTTLKVIIARLKSKLLDISELFNNIAMPHKVWVRIVPESTIVPRPSFLRLPLPCCEPHIQFQTLESLFCFVQHVVL